MPLYLGDGSYDTSLALLQTVYGAYVASYAPLNSGVSMTNSPHISVIMPAYNHERFVGAAVASVLEQSFDELELIVINDGSTDSTEEVVKSFSDSRLCYLYQDNQDAYNTLNRGLQLARGEFIAILNSDDVYTVDRLERLSDAHKQTEAQCIFSDVTPIDDQGAEIHPNHGWNAWHQSNRNVYFEHHDLYVAFLHGNFMVTTSNLFITTPAAKRVGEFCSLRYLHDYDYIFRVLLAYPEHTLYLGDERLLYYRIHGGNTLNQAAIGGREQDKSVIRKYMLARFPESQRLLINTGVDRLIALEHELANVRKELQDRDKTTDSTPPETTMMRLLRRVMGPSR